MAMTLPSAKAQESSTDETTTRFTIDGAFTWMGTWGNDVFVGETITIDQRFDRESGMRIIEEDASALVTEMLNKGMPWAQIGLERGKWGMAVEFWTLETEGSTATGAEPFEAFRYHDVGNVVEEWELDLRAENELSAWAMRVVLLRALSKSLTLGVGLHTGKLENRRNETLEFVRPLFDHETAIVETESKSIGTLVGPSVDLRGSAKIGGRTRVRFTAAQSVLFATFENQASWQSTVTYSEDFFGSMNRIEHLTSDNSTRVAIPVTDARAILSFDLGSHLSVGVLGLLSVWFDAPLAFRFSQLGNGWDAASSTLVFASLGPVVTVRF
jgi:hypothetical protein